MLKQHYFAVALALGITPFSYAKSTTDIPISVQTIDTNAILNKAIGAEINRVEINRTFPMVAKATSNQANTHVEQRVPLSLLTSNQSVIRSHTKNFEPKDRIRSLKEALDKVAMYRGQQQLRDQYAQIATLNLQNSGLWKNPSISVQKEGFGSGSEKTLSFSIHQPLDLFGARKLNQRIAQTELERNQLELNLWQAQGQLIVKYHWAQMSLAQVEQRIYEAQFKVSQDNLDSAKKRYQAGSIALVDYERAQIEALENQRLYQQALLSFQVAQHRLSNLWGEAKAEIDLTAVNMPWPEQSQEVVQAYIASGGLEKLYVLNLIQAKNRISQFKVQAKPNPMLSVGMSSTQSFEDRNTSNSRPSENTLMLGVEWPLNIFNRQQYSIPMAQQHQLLLSQHQQREFKQQIFEIANVLQQLKALKIQFNSVSEQISLVEKVQQRSSLGFRSGKLSLTDAQQASMQLQSIRLGQLNVLKQAWQSALSAEALSLGISYEQISASDAYSQLNKTIVEQSEKRMNMGVQ